MHYHGDCYNHLCLPGSGCVTETIQRCPPQPDACSTTCHPLSITKSPVPRWQSCTQPFTYVCPNLSASQAALLTCQPYLQKCVVLYPEPCETTQLLPCRKPSVKLSPLQSFQPCDSNLPVKKRVAKSLPPCAPRCPEPSKLKFPPCGIRSSASCREGCRSQKISKCSTQRCSSELQTLQGLTSGYSRPLRGATECPPQQCTVQSFLGEYVQGFPHQKCMKGYPTQEYVTTYSSQPCITKSPPRPQPLKCPPGQGTKERSSQQLATKSSSLAQEGAKHKSSSTQHLSKSKCLHPRAAQHSTQHHGAAKRSGAAKKSRCGSRWLW